MKRIVVVVSSWDELFVANQTGELRVIRENGVWYTLAWCNNVPRVAPCSFEQLVAMGVVING